MTIKHIIFFSCLHLVVYAQFVCDQYKDCKILRVGDFVPDMYDCERYYVCLDSSSGPIPSQSSIPCPAGEYFEASVSPARCIPETVAGVCTDNYCARYEADICPTACPSMDYQFVMYPGDCGKYYYCTPVGIIENSCHDATPYFDGQKCVSEASACCYRCVPYCTAAGTEIPDPYDSTKYYICTAVGPPDELNHVACPSGQYFDSPLGICVAGMAPSSFC